jgi:hypothetical protein
MKRLHSSFLIFLSILASTAFADLDLTPRKYQEDRDGSIFNFLSCVYEGRRYRFEQPTGTQWSGGGKKLSFRFVEKSLSEIKLTVAAKSQAPLLETSDKAKAEWAKAFAGDRIQDIQFVEENQNVFSWNERAGTEKQFVFSQDGIRFRLSVSEVELNGEESLYLVAIAREQDFAEVRTAAHGSMYSWAPISE